MLRRGFGFKFKSVLLATFIVTGLIYLTAAQHISAASFTYPSYDVDIDVHTDSTVDVTETLTYKFSGEFHGVFRKITLEDPAVKSACRSQGLTCGGFERIAILGVYEGRDTLLSPNQYDVYEEKDEDTKARYFVVKLTEWPAGKYFTSTDPAFTWSVKYRLYGSIGWVQNYAGQTRPYLYWNALPETRGGGVDKSTITVNFPSNVVVDKNKFDLYASYRTTQSISATSSSIVLDLNDLSSYGSYTLSYEFGADEIQRPAALDLTPGIPITGTDVIIDGINLGDIGSGLENFPVGQHTVELRFPGYESKLKTVEATPGEVITIDKNLMPTTWMSGLLILDVICFGIGGLLCLAAIWFVYYRWRSKGRDQKMPATIIPLYHPPEDVRPYLFGSLYDEKVDAKDITGSIIDLAYRGYIKIEELKKGSNYKLYKLEGKKGDPGLNDTEESLIDGLFGGKDEVETKKIGPKFYAKYQLLRKDIYQEMVDRKYFPRSPETTRNTYKGCGIILAIFGGVLSWLVLAIGLSLLGVPGPFTLPAVLLVLGLGFLIAGDHMPAKTEIGSKVYAEILGFKMYLYTAERYRLQNLKPEEFERYLSFAIVLGIEKQWADKFKDIYKQQPDWYVGSDNMLWDAYFVSSFARSFSNSVTTTMFTPGSGSGRGSGWSGGGGSFGGFSGGGGGGGGSGAF